MSIVKVGIDDSGMRIKVSGNVKVIAEVKNRKKQKKVESTITVTVK